MEFKTNLYVIMSNDLKSIFLENGMFVNISELKGREKFKRYYNIGGAKSAIKYYELENARAYKVKETLSIENE